MNIIFSGDRNSKTIKVGHFFKKYISCIKIMLWDNYKSKIYIQQ